MRIFVRDLLIILVLAAVAFGGLQITFDRYVVDGNSMNTSLQDEQKLLVNKLVYNFHEPERGDIVVFHAPGKLRDSYIKRIIGLPGESVSIKDGVVYIHQPDGTVFALDEPYIAEPATEDFEGEIILENQYFFLGDNRNNSEDSRTGWMMLRQNIVGKAWLSIWPPSEWGTVSSYPTLEPVAGLAN